MITKDILRELYPQATNEKINLYIQPIVATCDEFGIATIIRQAAFLAQIGYESGQLNYVREIWGPTEAQLRYEGRKDLGNFKPGDGKRFMGRGLIQITGRDNYRRCGDALYVNLEEEPELLETPLLAARSAGWYWRTRAINVPADLGDIDRVSKLVNGGINGLPSRRDLYAAALKALSP